MHATRLVVSLAGAALITLLGACSTPQEQTAPRPAASQATAPTPQPRSVQLAFPAVGSTRLPLTLTLPDGYIVWTEPPVVLPGQVMYFADSDLNAVIAAGVARRAVRASIRILHTTDRSYDVATGKFSFEDGNSASLLAMGATQLQVTKRTVRGVPLFAQSFETGSLKFYSMYLAGNSEIVVVQLLSGLGSRAQDDAIWLTLLQGL